ncbi:MAG: hypothetical protein ACRELB_24995 [Polyangiaceae bacterium]
MSVAVVGLGLVTPFADTPTEHVFFLRAGVPAPPPSPFRLRTDGSPLYVSYCRWLGAAAPIEQRLTQLGTDALREALRPIGSKGPKAERRVMLCLPTERPGVAGDTLDAVASSVAAMHGEVQRFSDDAGAFRALRAAQAALQSGEASLVLVAATDSFVALQALDERVVHPPSPWGLDPPAPSEGAAAVALMQPHEARRLDVPILGHLVAAATARGASNDDNDLPVDGAAMSVVLRDLATSVPAWSAFGPFRVDLLRHDDWQLASARLTTRFAPRSTFACLESQVGRLGAASGLANLVYGLASHRHRAAPALEASAAPFYAWAISPDGARGAALLSVREP